MNITLPLGLGIKTFYKFIRVNPETNKETVLTDWIENTILTSGRNELANRDWFTAVQVGTSSVLPNASQTALLGYVAGTTTVQEDVNGAQSSAPYYGWRRKRFRFAVGTISQNENLNEVGLGWSTASGDFLVTRALIEDINGNQVTVTWKADEYLDVVVEVRYYPPAADATGTVVLNGVTYDYILRAANVVSTTAWSTNIGSQITSVASAVGDWAAFDDNIQTVDLGPNGVSYNGNTNDYTNAYVNNSYQIVFGMIAGPNEWNATTGKLMRSLRIKTTAGWYQIQFDSQSNPGFGIPKTTDYTLTMQFVLGWSEQVIP